MAKRVLSMESDVDKKIIKVESPQGNPPLTPTKVMSKDPHATVTGILASISPTKPKSTFFDGELTDGDTVMRLVGFDKEVKNVLEGFFKKNVPVTLNNCQIQENKFTKKLEILVKTYTIVEASSVNFKEIDVSTIGSDIISLAELPKKSEYDRVTVRIQVTKVEGTEVVGRGKKKQEIVIADSTGVANLTLWEEDIGSLKADECYQLNRVVVRTYRGKRHLSFPQSGATSLNIENIGEVMDESCDLDSDDKLIEGAKVIGVHDLTNIYNCFCCKRGTVEPDKDNKFGKCTQCSTYQVLKQLKVTAKLFLESHDISEHVTIRAYGDLLTQIVAGEEVSTESLLKAPPFDARYNEYHVLTSIQRY